jgi:hypothetical protein
MEQVSLGRIVNSLLQHANHKNTAYRSKVALLADHLVERHGSSLSDRRVTMCISIEFCSVYAGVMISTLRTVTGTLKGYFKQQPLVLAVTVRKKPATAASVC